jgi:hypothetical protein
LTAGFLLGFELDLYVLLGDFDTALLVAGFFTAACLAGAFLVAGVLDIAFVTGFDFSFFGDLDAALFFTTAGLPPIIYLSAAS